MPHPCQRRAGPNHISQLGTHFYDHVSFFHCLLRIQ